MDDLLLKAEQLVDPELTLGSSDDDVDKLLFEALCQVEPVSPAIATYSWIQQMHQYAIPMKTKQTTS